MTAATAMSVIHIESSAPTMRKPSSTRSARVPAHRSTYSTMRVPSPENVNPVDRNSTPMKNTMRGLPKPAFTADAKSVMPKAAMSTTTRSEVTANGIASPTHRVTAKSRIARHVLPSGVRGISSPARSRGAGTGSRCTTAMRAVAPTRMRSARWSLVGALGLSGTFRQSVQESQRGEQGRRPSSGADEDEPRGPLDQPGFEGGQLGPGRQDAHVELSIFRGLTHRVRGCLDVLRIEADVPRRARRRERVEHHGQA